MLVLCVQELVCEFSYFGIGFLVKIYHCNLLQPPAKRSLKSTSIDSSESSSTMGGGISRASVAYTTGTPVCNGENTWSIAVHMGPLLKRNKSNFELAAPEKARCA